MDQLLIIQTPIPVVGVQAGVSALLVETPRPTVGVQLQPQAMIVAAGSQGPSGVVPNVGNGFIVQTSPNNWIARVLTSLTTALTIANADGVVAAPTFDLSAELKSAAAIATTGYVKRGAAAWTTAASVPWSDVSATPTTLAGYGVTDPVALTTGAYANPGWITSLAWSKVSGTPTTVGGYGITDAYTKTQSDANYLPLHGTADNAAQLLGSTWAVPGAIGSTTPAAGTFTTVSAGDGTAQAPSWTFTSQSSLGFYKEASATLTLVVGGTNQTRFSGTGITIQSGGAFAWGNAGTIGSADTFLYRDAGFVIAQRNGTNAQTFRLYNTFTDASNYERFAINWASNVVLLAPEAAGTGTVRNLKIAFGALNGLNPMLRSGGGVLELVFGNETDWGDFRARNYYITAKLNFPSGTILLDDAVNVLALRNGANAQTQRWYASYTDASNYTRASLSATTSAVTLAAESAGTGSANVHIILTPKGTGGVGIFTSNPTQPFDLNGNAIFRGPNTYFLANAIFGDGNTLRFSDSGGTLPNIQSLGKPLALNSGGNNVLIGTSTDNASAILNVVSTTQGFLPPRMTTTQRDAIASPASGLVIYNTTTGKLNVRGATAWEAVTSA